MKKAKIIALLLGTIFFSSHAQDLSSAYSLKPGTLLKKQPVSYLSVQESGQDKVWDFSDIELSGSGYTVKYSLAPGGDSILTCTERGIRQYYRSTSSSLMLLGYENSATSVAYNRPELQLSMPLVYGERRRSLFHGTAVHGSRVYTRQFGTSCVEVDATGKMLLPSGDTLRHVSRVHITEVTGGQHFPHVLSEEELTFMTDSIAPFTDDSIFCHLATDSLLTETHAHTGSVPV